MNDFIITTEGPLDSPYSAFSITKTANQDGTYSINFTGGCGNIFGCVPNILYLQAHFVNYINGTSFIDKY